MGKHEPMTAKAIANKIKAKGLQKIKYFCQMCNKQCRDDNGFKCHIMSEAHQRQALIVSENPEQFVKEFSNQFMEHFMFILKTHYKTKKILANTVFQEYIKDREHTHLNGTRWTSLTEFARWLGEQGMVEVDDSDRGVMIKYIDRDPETIRRKELEAKRARQAEEEAIKRQRQIEQQREAAKKVYESIAREAVVAEPIPIIRVETRKIRDGNSEPGGCAEEELPAAASGSGKTTTDCDKGDNAQGDRVEERPLFGVQAMTIKTATTSAYKPLKKRLVHKRQDAKKRLKSS